MTGESDGEDGEYETISIEYSPLELTTLIQLLDYLDIFMHQNELPMGVAFLHRKKLYEAIIKEDILKDLKEEKQSQREELKESFNFSGDEEIDFSSRDGFQ